MDSLVVQVGERHGRVAEVTRCKGNRLNIGRAYDNDLILTDLHVGPHQLSCVRSNEGWLLEVLDNTNPVLLNNTRVEGNANQLKPGDEITIGRTRLLVFSANQPVEPTRKLVLSNWLSMESVGVFLPIAVLVLTCLADIALNFYYESTDLEWMEPASSILLSAVICLAWAGIWAITGKIIRQQHHFGLQLIVTSLMSLVTTLIAFAGSAIAFQLNSALANEIITWLVTGIALLLLFKLNFLIATNVRNTWIAATVLTGLFLGTFFSFSHLSEEEQFQSSPEYSEILLPPPLDLRPGVPSSEYFQGVRDELGKPAE